MYQSSKKETKPNLVADFNQVDDHTEPADDAAGDDAHNLSVDALRQVRANRGRSTRGRGGTATRGGQARPGFQGLCHYCKRSGHRIANCFTRMNDEKRGDGKAKAATASETAAVDTETANISAFDLDQYLNRFAM